jgi:hypothetical protein
MVAEIVQPPASRGLHQSQERVLKKALADKSRSGRARTIMQLESGPVGVKEMSWREIGKRWDVRFVNRTAEPLGFVQRVVSVDPLRLDDSDPAILMVFRRQIEKLKN